MSGRIHPTAVVDPGAKLHPTVDVGPFAVIGANVELGEGCVVLAHAIVEGRTRMGAQNRVFPGAVIGMPPQDLKYAGEPTRIEVGDHNTFREFVTVHPGTGEGGVTTVGSSNLFMAGVHVAHDCVVGNHVVLSNSVGLAGHVQIGDHVVVGGMTGFHQFVRVGRHAMVGGISRTVQDVPPYCLVEGVPAYVTRLNRIGFRRADLSPDVQSRLAKAFRILFRRRLPHAKAVTAMEQELGSEAPVAELAAFFRSSKRGVTRGLPSRRRALSADEG